MAFRFQNNQLKVLAYHAVQNKENFEQQIIYLKNKYNLISLEELKNFSPLEDELPPKSLLITFDDGDNSLFINALPVLKKHEVPAVIFIITGLIDTNRPFWWNEIEYYMGKEVGNKKVWEVKHWTNKKREHYLDSLRKKSNKPPLTYEQLATSQLREMMKNKIAIGNHSHTHPMFDQCTPMELEMEMEESTKILKSLNADYEMFAYPNGNYSEEAEGILRNKNIQLAFLFDHKINKEIINPLRISRLSVNDYTSIRKLKFILSGWHSRFLPVIKAIAKFKV